MALTRTDYLNLDRHIRYHRARIEAGQLRVAVSTDMADFVRTRIALSGSIDPANGAYAHPAYDPDYSIFPPGGAFWLSVANAEGAMVACAATRRFDNASLADLFLSRQIWYSREPILEGMEPIELDWPDDMPEIEGTLAVHGGLIVDPSLRGQKIGIHLIRLTRALSLRTWRQDWNFGLVRDALKDGDVPGRLYGYPHTVCAFSIRPPWAIEGDGKPGPTHDREWLNYISRAEMLAEYASAPDTLLT